MFVIRAFRFISNFLQLHIPNPGTLLQFHQCRTVIEECFYILGLHIIIRPLGIEYLQEGDFSTVIAVNLSVDYLPGGMKHTVFIMTDLFCQ